MRLARIALALALALAGCKKKPTDVAGRWVVDVEKTAPSIAKDTRDLALDPRMERLKRATSTPPSAREEIVKTREKELRPMLENLAMELEFLPDGKVITSTMIHGERVRQAPQDWKLVDGKVVHGGKTLEFEGGELKGALFDGHPGAAYLRKQ